MPRRPLFAALLAGAATTTGEQSALLLLLRGKVAAAAVGRFGLAAPWMRGAASGSDSNGRGGGGTGSGSSSGGRQRPRSPIAMAHFDYQLELEARLAEDEGGAMPDAEAAFEILANHRIREAMAAGEFNDLPGKGAPLRDRTDETSGDFSLKVLKNANALPEWVELGKALRGRLSGVHATIEPFVREVLEARPHSLAEALRRLKANPDWAAARAGLEADLETINRAIARHNALTPSAAVHMFPVRLDAAVSAMYKRLQQEAVEQRNAGS